VTTVDDRVLRYDAIRPDVWLHLAFGQGFGTYSVRVLDNELLGRLIEGGVLGLGAYVVMLGAMVFVAASAIRRRAPGCQAVAPVVAAAAASVLVMSAMYDLMGYPHDPYILLSLAGLLAVAVRSERPSPAPVRASAGVKRSPRPSLEEAWSY
jgi:O-antigen ligase